jgi:hypothetical protein
MPKVVQTIRVLLLLFLIVLFADTGCASAKKSSGYAKKKEGSRVNASQLGRNKYYFSLLSGKKLKRGLAG